MGIMVYLIPVVVMTICYSMILVKLFCRTQPGEHPIGGHREQYLWATLGTLRVLNACDVNCKKKIYLLYAIYSLQCTVLPDIYLLLLFSFCISIFLVVSMKTSCKIYLMGLKGGWNEICFWMLKSIACQKETPIFVASKYIWNIASIDIKHKHVRSILVHTT